MSNHSWFSKVKSNLPQAENDKYSGWERKKGGKQLWEGEGESRLSTPSPELSFCKWEGTQGRVISRKSHLLFKRPRKYFVLLSLLGIRVYQHEAPDYIGGAGQGCRDHVSRPRKTPTIFKTQDLTISPHMFKSPPTLGCCQLKMKFSLLVIQPYLLSTCLIPTLLTFKFYWEEAD